jgi:ubiquinone/menaquinone biosynthesis C-methylase UbiE
MPHQSISSFLKHSPFESIDGLYYQKDLPRKQLFEDNYIILRKLEGRLYDDEVAGKLPEINSSHPTANEWRVRKRSTERLIKFLKTKQSQTILEVGCGNGWLIHAIQSALQKECLGIDINEIELLQASRVFGRNHGLHFVYGDILSQVFNTPMADAIIVASVIQYFPDAQILIEQLLKLLKPGGQVHILDSPIYIQDTKEAARQRSEKYFKEMGQDEMRLHYFHHTWEVLKPFNYSIEYDPSSPFKKLWRLMSKDSPFPWIVIDR